MKRTTKFFLICIGLTLAFEVQGLPGDPWADQVWRWESDLSTWLPIHIIVSPLEICLIVIAVIWLCRGHKLKRAFAFQPGTLQTPVLVFLAFVAFGVLNGAAHPGGNLTIALWEVRGFLMLIGMYFLTGIFIRGEREVNRLIWTIFTGTTVLAVEDILRWMFLLQFHTTDDLSFDHIDSVVMVCALLLGAAICIFGGTRSQRKYAYFIMPLSFFCMLIMERRAAFPVMGVGVIALLVFLLRLRPRQFWKYVPPLALICAIYLAAFWHNTSVLGQPARAIASQFSPDYRDLSSDIYRAVEKADIIFNIQSAPITGLGFGQQFQMYIPLSDLSFWPFWHYMTHNAILWVWMKDGIAGFVAFWWLLGRGAHDGGKAVETQREEWALVQYLRKRLSRQAAEESDWRMSSSVFRVVMRPTTPDAKRGKRHATAGPSLGLNVPAWERSDHKHSVTAQRSGALALLVMSISMIPAQVVFSYVDLGLTSERNMLLFGLMLGLVARGHALLGTQVDGAKKSLLRASVEPATSDSSLDDEAAELARQILLTSGGGRRSRPLSRPLRASMSRPISHPLVMGPSPSQPPQRPHAPPSQSRGTVRSRPIPARPHPTASRPFAPQAAPTQAYGEHQSTEPPPWDRTARLDHE